MFKINKLKNGLRIVSVPMKGVKTITALVLIGTGSKYENRDNNGISHFLEHMFFKGTTKRPNTLKIASELDGIGGEYNAFTSKEFTGYYVKTDSQKIGIALDVLNDMLFDSKFDSEEINREKGVITEEINMKQDEPMSIVEDLFEEVVFGDTPAGWDIAGPKENIAKFTRKDFIDYLSSQYKAENTIICLAGNVTKGAVKIAEKYFNTAYYNYELKFKDKEKVKDSQESPMMMTHFKKTDQAHLSLGVRTYGMGHKDETVLKIIAILLGGTMSSRLFIELRERRGLAYYVRSESEVYTDSGYLTTGAGVPIDKADEAIKIILGEYKKLKEELVGKEELKRIKDLIRGRVAIKLEASDDVAVWYGRQFIPEKRKKVLTPENFFKKIDKVSAKDIMRVANEIFIDKKLNLAVVGPFESGEKFGGLLKF